MRTVLLAALAASLAWGCSDAEQEALAFEDIRKMGIKPRGSIERESFGLDAAWLCPGGQSAYRFLGERGDDYVTGRVCCSDSDCGVTRVWRF